MHCQHRVRILLGTPLLHRALSGKPAHEKGHLYFECGKKYGVCPVLFDLNGLHLKKQTVTGYVWKPSKRHYVPTVCPLPKVVHKRDYMRSPKLAVLSRFLGKRLFNPQINRNKLAVYTLLRQNPAVRPYLPDTRRVQNTAHVLKTMQRYPTVFVKPAIGSLGKNVIKIKSLGKHRYIFYPDKGNAHSLSSTQLKRELTKRRLRYNHYIIQQGIPLATYCGSPFDLRVSVQKGGNGRWQMSGTVAKVAQRNGILTNLSQNGRAVPTFTVLSRAFPKRHPQNILQKVRRLAIDVCRILEKTYPAFADAGLDIGLDHDGRPWLIEVNFRDLRYAFLSAGEYKMFKKTYDTPMQYAKYLLTSKRG